jgi:cytochrome c oxidase subunit 1
VGWELTLDRLGLWVIVAIALIAIAYGPFLLTYDVVPVSGPFRAF